MKPADADQDRLRLAGLPGDEEQKRLLEQATLLLRYRLAVERRMADWAAASAEDLPLSEAKKQDPGMAVLEPFAPAPNTDR